jgi:hypothetical protein
MDWSDFRGLILDNLSDDLLTSKYRRLKKKFDVPDSFGHCYVASEASYHLLGGKEEGWTPQFIRHLGEPHWFLKHKSGFILDLTYNQFKSSVDYSKSRGIGFLTKEPSKRTKKLIKKIAESEGWAKLKKSHRLTR